MLKMPRPDSLSWTERLDFTVALTEEGTTVARFNVTSFSVVAVAALTFATYLVLTKYHGKEYLIERLKRRDEAIRLD